MTKHNPSWLGLTCHNCNKSFRKLSSQVRGKTFVYCSRPCYHAGKKKLMLSRIYRTGYIPDEQLISDLQSLARKLGRVPIPKDVQACWPGRPTKYYRRFGSWHRALLLAGIDRREYLLREIQRVAQVIGHTPTDSEMRLHSHYPISQYWKMFSAWSHACELAGLIPHTTYEGGPFRVPRYQYQCRGGKVVKLQGSYEYRFAKVLDSLNLEWLSHGEFAPLIYNDEKGKTHKYMPDFYIVTWDLYVETKGWYQTKDKIKMAFVTHDNPNVTIIVVGKHSLNTFERTGHLPLF